MKQETITGSCDSKGLFTAKNPHDKPMFTGSAYEGVGAYSQFEGQHPQLFTYTHSNELVTDVENVEVIGPVWQYREGNPYPFVKSPNNINEKSKGYETRQVYLLTVSQTEQVKADAQPVKVGDESLSDTIKSKLFNADQLKGVALRFVEENFSSDNLDAVEKAMLMDVFISGYNELIKSIDVYVFDYLWLTGAYKKEQQLVSEIHEMYNKKIKELATPNVSKEHKPLEQILEQHGIYEYDTRLNAAIADFNAQFATEAGGGKDIKVMADAYYHSFDDVEYDKCPTIQECFIAGYNAITAPSNNSSSEMVRKADVINLIESFLPEIHTDALITQILTIKR